MDAGGAGKFSQKICRFGGARLRRAGPLAPQPLSGYSPTSAIASASTVTVSWFSPAMFMRLSPTM